MAFVFRPRRKKNGKSVPSEFYSGRYRLEGDLTTTTVSLGVRSKEVAEKKLRDLIRQKERERVGLELPEICRETLDGPIAKPLQSWLDDLQTKGRSDHYIYVSEKSVLAVCRETGWKTVGSIRANEFIEWRNAHRDKAAKTLAEYLNTFNAFLNWLVKTGRIESNPLARVEQVETRGKERRVRRVLTEDEFHRLLEVSPPERRLTYVMGAFTGLRKGELRQMEWRDLSLDGDLPFVRARAATTKNKKTEPIPLHHDLVEVLRDERRKRVHEGMGENILQIEPRTRYWKRDLAAAGVPYKDDCGEVFDFHSLRHTFGTGLAKANTSVPTSMRAMRQSDPKLTLDRYVYANALPLAESINKIPGFLKKNAPENSPLDALESGQSGHSPSLAVSDCQKSSSGTASESGSLHPNPQNYGERQMEPAVGLEPTT
ncbi:MAG: site-specific integrase [Verrucomicrobiota bacterium]